MDQQSTTAGLSSIADDAGLNLPISNPYNHNSAAIFSHFIHLFYYLLLLFLYILLFIFIIYYYYFFFFDIFYIFLADTWVFWYDDSPLKSNHSEYDINFKVLGEFSTIQVQILFYLLIK